MATPIFVLGIHRSGTTWLGNQLCQHPLVTGVTHEKHEGIHESAYFTWVYNRYGNLARKTNYIEFVEAVGASDYFQLAGVSKSFLYSLWPTTYEGVFRAVMDDYAQRRGAKYWVEKSPSHTLVADKIARSYPDARFIAITRDIEAVVSSMVNHSRLEVQDKRARHHVLVASILSWTFYNRLLTAFSNKADNVLVIRYETLRADLTTSLQQICAFLDLPFDLRMAEQSFEPNTSFQTINRQQALSRYEQNLVGLLGRVFQIIPVQTLTTANRLLRIKRHRDLPWWFYKLHPFNQAPQAGVEADNLFESFSSDLAKVPESTHSQK